MNELALFAGSGGGILGGHLLGWRTVAAVEIEDYPRRVLLQRQADGFLPRFPVWDDICTFDGKPWRGRVDVISGGFPCQDISAAGKGDGLDGERSGLWTQMARVVGEVRPPFVFVENSPMLTTRGGVRVIADLTQMGYDTTWTVMGAADIGAPHQRDRMWIVARRRDVLSYPQHDRIGRGKQQQESPQEEDGNVANTASLRQSGQGQHEQPINSAQGCNWQTNYVESIGTPNFWQFEPAIPRVADGVAHRVDRLKAIGNGQVPLCAASAWRLLTSTW